VVLVRAVIGGLTAEWNLPGPGLAFTEDTKNTLLLYSEIRLSVLLHSLALLTIGAPMN